MGLYTLGLILIPVLIIVLCLMADRKKKEEDTSSGSPFHSYRPLTGRDTGWENDAAQKRGAEGEDHIRRILRDTEGYNRYLTNCYIPTAYGHTTEIDLIMLHESGIYVIESKNYSGWIFGTQTQQNWTQTLPIGPGKSEKHTFYNPILQNAAHIRWLSDCLGFPDCPIYSYIVFGDDCVLKRLRLTDDTHRVINAGELRERIRQDCEKTPGRLTPQRIDALYHKLEPLTQADAAIRQKHIQDIRAQKDVKEQLKHLEIPLPPVQNPPPVHKPPVFKANVAAPGGPLIQNTIRELAGSGHLLLHYPAADDKGRISAIEAVLIHQTGVHLFELQDCSGWIFGTESHNTWTQTVPTGQGSSEKRNFPNPVMQSEAHIRWLSRYLNGIDCPFFSYILFGDDCILKDLYLSVKNCQVLNLRELRKVLKDRLELSAPLLSGEQINSLYQQLSALSRPAPEQAAPEPTAPENTEGPVHDTKPRTETPPIKKPRQIRYITLSDSEPVPPEERCPWCGGKLVLRTASHGKWAGNQFWGCVNYPKCRYIKNQISQ